jgi:hypothetical protein
VTTIVGPPDEETKQTNGEWKIINWPKISNTNW